ncbi:MAG: DEAD/DEAH box helicase, partial [Thermodesulfatator sp.]
ATPTASGKTLIYNVPVIEKFLERPESRALYLFPLKALAQDQLKAFNRMSGALSSALKPGAVIYDGDTSQRERTRIRKNPPNCLFTNPEMLHLSLLPYHGSWAVFWRNLSYVIIDEVHTYRGIMGSSMGWVFRRLRRICKKYGADPVFVLCSATIGNPDELAENLTGLKFQAITRSGAPQGKRHLLLVDPEGAGAAQTAVQLLLAAIKRGLRTICYTQSRKLTELVSLWAIQRAGQLSDKISAYRAGFLPEERRLIEASLSSGELLSVISTSALELGIDIGLLDICILVGYPGTLMSLRQRGGRVGRSSRESAVILVAGEDALDKYFMNHPRELIERPSENAVVNVYNKRVMKSHLLCAATEEPIKREEWIYQDRISGPFIEELVKQGSLYVTGNGTSVVSLRKYPHRDVELRGAGRSFQILTEDGMTIGTLDGYRVFKEAHPGAVYIHRGNTFLVKDLDIEARKVTVRPARVDYFTRVRASKETHILEVEKRAPLFGSSVFWGRLLISEQVTGYDVRHVRGQRLINRVDLELPAQKFETEGLWITIPEQVKKAAEKQYLHFMGGIHAIEHAAIGIMPLLVLCDRNDLGGISTTFHYQTSAPAVFVYDGIPGGVGLTAKAFEKAENLLETTLQTIQGCPCENGCPSCVHSPKCGSGNRPIDKSAALFVLDAIRNGPRTQPSRLEIKGPSVNSENKPRDKTIPDRDREEAGAKRVSRKRHGQGPQRQPVSCLSLNRFGVLDVETQRSAQEVGGWHRAHKMKVSCAVIYDSLSKSYLTFLEHQLAGLFSLLGRMDLVIGFNIKRFDYKVLSAYAPIDLRSLPTLDLLEHVHDRLGYRLSLDSLASSTLGKRKSADGLQALKWWKQGRIKKIMEYCKKDVEITRDLFLFGMQHGYVLFRNKDK